MNKIDQNHKNVFMFFDPVTPFLELRPKKWNLLCTKFTLPYSAIEDNIDELEINCISNNIIK